jgi:hypothetical protein
MAINGTLDGFVSKIREGRLGRRELQRVSGPGHALAVVQDSSNPEDDSNPLGLTKVEYGMNRNPLVLVSRQSPEVQLDSIGGTPIYGADGQMVSYVPERVPRNPLADTFKGLGLDSEGNSVFNVPRWVSVPAAGTGLLAQIACSSPAGPSPNPNPNPDPTSYTLTINKFDTIGGYFGSNTVAVKKGDSVVLNVSDYATANQDNKRMALHQQHFTAGSQGLLVKFTNTGSASLKPDSDVVYDVFFPSAIPNGSNIDGRPVAYDCLDLTPPSYSATDITASVWRPNQTPPSGVVVLAGPDSVVVNAVNRLNDALNPYKDKVKDNAQNNFYLRKLTLDVDASTSMMRLGFGYALINPTAMGFHTPSFAFANNKAGDVPDAGLLNVLSAEAHEGISVTQNPCSIPSTGLLNDLTKFSDLGKKIIAYYAVR